MGASDSKVEAPDPLDFDASTAQHPYAGSSKDQQAAKGDASRSFAAVAKQTKECMLKRGPHGFGLVLIGARDDREGSDLGKGIFISHIRHESPAGQMPALRLGQQIVTFNDVDVSEHVIPSFAPLLKRCGEEMRLVLKPRNKTFERYAKKKEEAIAKDKDLQDLMHEENSSRYTRNSIRFDSASQSRTSSGAPSHTDSRAESPTPTTAAAPAAHSSDQPSSGTLRVVSSAPPGAAPRASPLPQRKAAPGRPDEPVQDVVDTATLSDAMSFLYGGDTASGQAGARAAATEEEGGEEEAENERERVATAAAAAAAEEAEAEAEAARRAKQEEEEAAAAEERARASEAAAAAAKEEAEQARTEQAKAEQAKAEQAKAEQEREEEAAAKKARREEAERRAAKKVEETEAFRTRVHSVKERQVQAQARKEAALKRAQEAKKKAAEARAKAQAARKATQARKAPPTEDVELLDDEAEARRLAAEELQRLKDKEEEAARKADEELRQRTKLAHLQTTADIESADA